MFKERVHDHIMHFKYIEFLKFMGGECIFCQDRDYGKGHPDLINCQSEIDNYI